MVLRAIAILLTVVVTGLVALGAFAAGSVAAIMVLAGGLIFVSAAFATLRGGLIAAPIGIAGGATAIAAAVLLLLGALAVGLWHRGDNTNRFLNAYMRDRMPSVFDGAGRWIGAYPAGAFVDHDADSGLPGQMTIASRHGPPTAFTQCALFLEDRNFKNWMIAALGVDFTGIIRAGLTFHGGGSGFVQMTSRAMRHLSPSRNEPFLARWRRKLLEWSDSPALAAIVMAPDRDPIEFITDAFHFVVAYKPMHVGELPAGLEFAGRTLFGVPAEDLSEPQQLILSAAIWLPAVIAPESDRDGMSAVEGRWRKLQARARRCAPLIAASSGRTVASVTAEINALPPPRIKINGLEYPHSAGATEQFKIIANPARRMLHVVGSAGLQAIDQEVTSAAGGDWRGKINTVKLGIDADLQAALATDIRRAIKTIETRHHDRLLLHLSGPDDVPNRAQVLAVIADLNGVIRGFFESGPMGALDQKRQGGSVDKIIGAVILGHHDRSGTGYCNKAIAGLHNAGGREGATKCSQAGAYLAARDVFARSLTLALINRLSKLPRKEIQTAVRTLGFELPPATPPATAIAAGYIEGSPRMFMTMLIAIARAIAGREGDAVAPHMIDGLEPAATVTLTAAKPTHRVSWPDIKELIVPSTSYMRDVLGAVLQRGTLSSLRHFHQSQNPEIQWAIGKTGTSTLLSGLTRDAMIAGAFETREGQAYVYFVLVGAPEPRQPLGRLNGTHLAPIAAALISNFLSRRSAHYATR